MKISLFKNVIEVKNPEILDLIDYLTDTRDGKWEIDVGLCRNIKIKEDRDDFKRKMPTACLSGTFTHRADVNLITHSEIIAMDLDDVDNINAVKSQLKKDKYVFSVFLSTSGNGLRVLFKIDPLRHKESFKGLLQYISDNYGVDCDTNSSLSKPYVVSHDPDLYLNPDYKEIPIFKKYIKDIVVKNVPIYIHNNDDFDNSYKQIIGRRINICENYDEWLKIGFGIADCFGESGRDYFHGLSSVSDRYNHLRCDKQYTYFLRHNNLSGSKIYLRSFYYLAKQAGVNIVSERTKQVIRTTKSGKRAGLNPDQISKNLKEKGEIEGVDELINNIYNSNEKDDFEDSEESMLSTLELFISNSYNLRFNEISGLFEDSGNPVDPITMNSIFIAAKKILPKLDYQLMIRLLKSDFIPTFNPIFEFFGSDGIPVILPATPEKQTKKYDSPLIDLLSECIINEDQAYTRYFLRKWLVSIISSAHKVHSPLLFCLLGEKGTGKTEFFRRLMPRQLDQYYGESKLDKEKDDELLMTEMLIIMDDELGGKSKSDALKLKNITSKQYFSLRRPYADHNEKILRLAVLCGTSNYLQIMSDPSGNRRIIPIHVKDIDKEKMNSINKKDLWMEMFRLYKEGFDWRVLHSDLKLLNKDEDKYTVVTKERELIQRYFESIPEDDERIKNCTRMTTTDIIVEIEQLTAQRMNVNIVGIYLDELGFVKKSTRVGKFNERVTKLWCVEKINRGFPPTDEKKGFTPISGEPF